MKKTTLSIWVFITLLLAVYGQAYSYGLDWSPSSYNYGNVGIGEWVDAEFTLKNNTYHTLSNMKVSIQSSPEFQIISPSLSEITLGPKKSVKVTIRFKPSSIGRKVATIEVEKIVPLGTISCMYSRCRQDFKYYKASLNLYGRGVRTQIIEVTPTSHDFGTLKPQETATQAFTVKSLGSVPLVLSSIYVSSGTADFSIVSNTCQFNKAMAAGTTCTFTVQFKPADLGAKSGTVKITSNAPTKSVSLYGMGSMQQQNSISVTPTTHNYGNVIIGNEASKSFTITNTGYEPVTLRTLTLSNITDFSIRNFAQECPKTVLEKNETCTFTIHFNPTQVGTISATLDIVANLGGTQPTTTKISLTGTGVVPATNVQVDPPSFNFGDTTINTSTLKTFVVTNYNPISSVTIQQVNIAGGAEFSVVKNQCSTLGPKDSCSIIVGFQPTSVGNKTATLKIHIQSNNQQSVINVSLSGQGVNPTPPPPQGDAVSRAKVLCSSVGGVWTESTSKCLIPASPEITCVGLGGRWMDTYCMFPLNPITY